MTGSLPGHEVRRSGMLGPAAVPRHVAEGPRSSTRQGGTPPTGGHLFQGVRGDRDALCELIGTVLTQSSVPINGELRKCKTPADLRLASEVERRGRETP